MVDAHTRRDAAGTSAMTVAGSVVGCLALHYLGRKGGEALVRQTVHRRQDRARDGRAAAQRRDGGADPVLLPPPAPFKIFILLAGVVGISATRFAIAIAIGRGIRYLALGILAVRYGERAMAYMREQRHRRLARRWSACWSPASRIYLAVEQSAGGQGPINRLSWPRWS